MRPIAALIGDHLGDGGRIGHVGPQADDAGPRRMLEARQHVRDAIGVAVGDHDCSPFATQCRGDDLAEAAGPASYQRSAILKQRACSPRHAVSPMSSAVIACARACAIRLRARIADTVANFPGSETGSSDPSRRIASSDGQGGWGVAGSGMNLSPVV